MWLLTAQRIPGTNSVVVVWNNAKPVPPDFHYPRVPLVFAVSHDNCKTWSRPVIILTKGSGFMKGSGYVREMHFSDTEMFINYEEIENKYPNASKLMMLVAYDLKTVLSLKPTTGSQAAASGTKAR